MFASEEFRELFRSFFKRTFITNKFWKSLVDFSVFYSNKVFVLKLSWRICCIDIADMTHSAIDWSIE